MIAIKANATPINFIGVTVSLKKYKPDAVTSTSLITSHSKFITVIFSYFIAAKNTCGWIAYKIVGIVRYDLLNFPKLMNFKIPRANTSTVAK